MTQPGARQLDVAAAKRALRARILAERARLTPPQLAAAAGALAAVALAEPAVAGASVVAAYVSVGSEPGTRALLDGLRARGVRVLVPVLLDDLDLDWAAYEGGDSLASAGRGLVEPVGPRLGVGAVAGAGAVLVPGLAAGRDGVRLGRGGGSYDRALARAGPGAYTAVLLYGGELLASVPAEEHDRRVATALTPDGAVRLRSDAAAADLPSARGG